MLKIGRIGAIFGFAVFLPVVASAQAAISGVVRDASGAVLPGVTVEAASPALIEKVRAAVTDGTGQYAIENLRPGLYTVTFTLPGFAVVQREGVELSGSFTARINADLRVGGIEETITVTGESPVVDVQSTRQQRVMDREILDALPNSGLRTALGVLIPSVDFRRQDVGGAGVRAVTGNMTAHGARSEDAGTTLNGLSIASFGTGAATSTLFLNPMGIQEITIDTGSNNAELHAGGVRTNYTLREGGNVFHGVVFGAYAPGKWQSDNLTDDLIARGLRTPNKIKANWDINPAFGGPILRDRIWFFGAARYNVTADYAAGLFWNRNVNNPNAWTYEPDPSRRVWNEQKQPDTQLRLSWQATSRHKLGFTWYDTTYCFCPTDASITRAWEAGQRADYPLQRLVAGDWTFPVTNRILAEGNGQVYTSESNRSPWAGLDPSMIPVQEQATGMRYRAGETYRKLYQNVYTFRGALSYVTERVHVPGRAVVRDGCPRVQGRRHQQERGLPLRRVRPRAGELSRQKRGTQSDHPACPGRMEGRRRRRPGALCTGSLDDQQADAELWAAVRLLPQQLSGTAHRPYDARPNAEHHFPGAGRVVPPRPVAETRGCVRPERHGENRAQGESESL